MDQRPLVNDQIEGGEALLVRLKNAVPVQAAYWLKIPDKRQWHLYVAIEKTSGGRMDGSYRHEVYRVLQEMKDPRIDELVRVIEGDNPVVSAVLQFLQRYPGSIPIRRDELMLGNTYADEVYIYPRPLITPDQGAPASSEPDAPTQR
jgi:hypothetical protein